MNYIDILLFLIIVLAIWAGWRKGFILGTINLVVWIGSLALGFLGYPYLASGLRKLFPSLAVWTLPLSFIITIIVSRLLLAFAFNRLLKRTPENVHGHNVNRVLGTIPGAVNGLVYATIAAAILLTVPLQNRLSDQTRKSQLANRLAVNIGWLDDKFSPIFRDAFRQTLTRKTVEPATDETVELNFRVDDAAPRADLETQMLALVNAERTSRGLKPLKADPELVPVARAHSDDMFRRGYFSHYSPEGRDPFDRMKAQGITYLTAGENLALGQTLRICHDGLMNSPGHRANILNPSYGRVGIGILDGGSYGLMISQEFRN